MMNSFPKIFSLGTVNTKSIFDDEVEITEKLDGSQIGFGKINGELIVRSKGAIINIDKPDDLFKGAVEHIKSISHNIPEGMFCYGEAFKKPKHNTLAYDRIPKNHIALFAVGWYPDEFISNYDYLQDTADRLDIDVVPLLFKGKIDKVSSSDFVMRLLKTKSILGGADIEGVVIKNYFQQCVITKDVIAPITCAKFVSEEFKEVHRGRWNKEEKPTGKFEQLAEGLKTEARWIKAINHLKDAGLLDESPKDIGSLIKEVHKDIEQEEKDYIKDSLYKIYIKDILGKTTNGLPEWYKERLMRNIE